MKRFDRIKRALLILLGIIVIFILLMLDQPRLDHTRSHFPRLKLPIANFEYPILNLNP